MIVSEKISNRRLIRNDNSVFPSYIFDSWLYHFIDYKDNGKINDASDESYSSDEDG